MLAKDAWVLLGCFMLFEWHNNANVCAIVRCKLHAHCQKGALDGEIVLAEIYLIHNESS